MAIIRAAIRRLPRLGGLYGTKFWVDPKVELVAIVMVQRFPGQNAVSSAFRPLVYQALTR
jgi:hypothetical protein